MCKFCNCWPSVASGICILSNLCIAIDRFWGKNLNLERNILLKPVVGLTFPISRGMYVGKRFHVIIFLLAVTVPSILSGVPRIGD